MKGERDYNAIIRFHVATPDKEIATAIADQCRNFFEEFGKCEIASIEKYWKMPEYYEIQIRSIIAKLTKQTVSDISNKIGPGITPLLDDFVWNKEEGNIFISPLLHWGCFDVISEFDLE